jgi:acetyltransferase
MAGVDFDHRFAFLALEGRGAARRVVADARLIDDADHPGRAELAIAIADGLQGLGIGPLMVRLLIDVARERGLEAVGAEVWWENQPMVRVLRRLGFERTAWDLGVMTFVLRLG